MTAKVSAIYIASKGEPPEHKASVQVEAGRGIVGDRYYLGTGTFSEKLAGNRKSEITFIASEEIDRFNQQQGESLDYPQVRRNVVTKGVQLADLIGKEFCIGSARFLGIEHCQPCAYLANTVNPKVMTHLKNTGLRAAILDSGTIAIGDPVVD